MRGLSLAMGVPVAGFGTLHMMSLASTMPMRRLVAVDARSDTYYTQICSSDGKPCEPPTARNLKACLALVAEDDEAKFSVIGTGAAALCTPDNSRFSADSARIGRKPACWPPMPPALLWMNWPPCPQPPIFAPTRCDPAGPAKETCFCARQRW